MFGVTKRSFGRLIGRALNSNGLEVYNSTKHGLSIANSYGFTRFYTSKTIPFVHPSQGSVSGFASLPENRIQSLDFVDLSTEESKRRLFNRLTYRSKQRGYLELDLVLGKWVEENISSMDETGIRSLVDVLNLENPELWKWLSGQEQPPEVVINNPVFRAVQTKVMSNLDTHASPETRATAGQPWVRGWDDFKKGELRNFYRLTPVAVIGGSFLPGLTGHNISEAAAAGCAVLTGNHVGHFLNMVLEMQRINPLSVLQVAGEVELCDVLTELFRNANGLEARRTAGKQAYFALSDGVGENVWNLLNVMFSNTFQKRL